MLAPAVIPFMGDVFRVAVMTAGTEVDSDMCLGLLQSCDRTICADGGYRLARMLGWRPQAVVGDFDSLGEEDRLEIERQMLGMKVHPREKDASDLELALELAHNWAADEVLILAALGGRLDHTMFNLIPGLCYCREKGMRGRVIGSEMEIFLAESQEAIADRNGHCCSVMALSRTVEGVVLQGFEYELQGETLVRHSSRGLSNRITSDLARIEVASGLLMVFVYPGREALTESQDSRPSEA